MCLRKGIFYMIDLDSSKLKCGTAVIPDYPMLKIAQNS